jgi:hypothetical protein
MNSLSGGDKDAIIPQEIKCPIRIINSKNTNCGCCTFRRSFTQKTGTVETKINVIKQEYSLLEQLFCCHLFNKYLGVMFECNSCSGCDCDCDCDCDNHD